MEIWLKSAQYDAPRSSAFENGESQTLSCAERRYKCKRGIGTQLDAYEVADEQLLLASISEAEHI